VVTPLEAHQSFGPERSKARRHEIFSSKHCGGHGDPYLMQVAARKAVKAVRGGSFFFPKLDGVAWLLPAPPMAWMARMDAAQLPLPRPWLQSFQKAVKDRSRRPLGFGEFLWIPDENWSKSGWYL
jgi:hypothetical protein